MRTILLTGVAAAATIMLPLAALADEAETLAHYDAYEAAMAQQRYDVAEAEAEAAWRGAEETWGGIEDTGVLAFNLVRLRLMGDRRTESIEPAERLKELVDSGAVTSITAAEATLFDTLAKFSGAGASRGELRDLEQALEAFTPSDFAATRIATLGWSYVANGRTDQGQFYDALAAADRASALMVGDALAPTALQSAVAMIGARAGYETGDLEKGLAIVQRSVAGFPAQPPAASIDPALASLLIWEQGLKQLYFTEEGRPYAGDPALANPVWDDQRPAAQGCTLAWTEQEMEAPRFGGPRPEGIGAVFEYRLAADGSVADVQVIGAAGEQPFAETLRGWRAEPPARPECQGPWTQVNAFLFPKQD